MFFFLSKGTIGLAKTACNSVLDFKTAMNESISALTVSSEPCSLAKSINDLAYLDATLNTDIILFRNLSDRISSI